MKCPVFFVIALFSIQAFGIEPACFPVSSSTYRQLTPAISGSFVVWVDYRNNGSGGEIYGLDLAAGMEYCIAPGGWEHKNPDIHGNVIVWQDGRSDGADIYQGGISDANERAVTNFLGRQENPAIDGNNVVFNDDANGPSDIYLYNLKTGNRRAICLAGRVQSTPDVCGNLVVWQDNRNISTMDIFAYDLTRDRELPICVNSLFWKQNAVTNGNIVVWQDKRAGDSNENIYGYDVANGHEFAICTHGGNQINPAISGNTVLWQDGRNGNDDDIYGYDLVTHTEFPVCTAAGNQQFPAVSGNTAVWQDGRSGTFNIYAANLKPATIHVTAPNGGEQIKSGGMYPVCWQVSGGAVSRVKVEFSTNSGNAWTTIDGNAPNSGSYPWQSPVGMNSSTCLVRISDKNDPAAVDTSDGAFSLYVCAASLTADISGDCFVDFRDFAAVARQWLMSGRSQ